MEEDLVDVKGEVVDTADKAIERVKAQVAHLYPNLYWSELNLFKIVKDSQLVDEKDVLDQ